jgi:hypothetical protein
MCGMLRQAQHDTCCHPEPVEGQDDTNIRFRKLKSNVWLMDFKKNSKKPLKNLYVRVILSRRKWHFSGQEKYLLRRIEG